MSRIEVVRGSELAAGDETQGIIRRKAFESENAIVSPSQGDGMSQLRPNQGDLQRLKEPFGKLLLGAPPKAMPELNSIIRRLHPRKVLAVGDVVARETYAAGIRVDLRISHHISMRQPT